MPFKARNPYYLRISEKTVLPLYVFLDERHIEWMSDRVLQHVLADLRPLIIPKLRAEADAQSASAGAKKRTVDVYKGDIEKDTYQFCFFFQNTEPHTVLIKTRTFLASKAAPQQIPTPSSPVPSTRKGKRKGRAPIKPVNEPKKRKTKSKGKGKQREDEDNDIIAVNENMEDVMDVEENDRPRRSKRPKKLTADGHVLGEDGDDYFLSTSEEEFDVEVWSDETGSQDLEFEGHRKSRAQKSKAAKASEIDMPSDAAMDESSPPLPLQVDEEESKPKPIMRLQYQGFDIYGHCLCIVVEPYPPFRANTLLASFSSPQLTRQRPGRSETVAPPLHDDTRAVLRAQTPLFLPEFDRERSVTPAPHPTVPAAPLFDDPRFNDMEDQDDELWGMMQYSQVLNVPGNFVPGAAEDDDEIDGAVFFADADEDREF